MIEQISIDGVLYAVTPTTAPALGDKVVTIDGVIYIIGEPVTSGRSAMPGEIDRATVNGAEFDLRDSILALFVQANTTAIANEATRATTAEQKLLRKIHGDAEVSDGRIEPFVSLGTFSSTESFVEHLDTMHSNNGAEYGKYVGAFRAMVSSSLIDVVNNTTYIIGDQWVQSVRGNFALQDGVLKLSSNKYGTFYRNHTAAGWSTWKQS